MFSLNPCSINEYEKLGSSVDYLSSVARIKALELPERETVAIAPQAPSGDYS